MRIDSTPGDSSEPWLTARDIIAEQGSNAEFFVIRLIGELSSEGNHEDAVLLFSVLQAIEILRELKQISPPQIVGNGQLVASTWPMVQHVGCADPMQPCNS